MCDHRRLLIRFRLWEEMDRHQQEIQHQEYHMVADSLEYQSEMVQRMANG